MYPFSPMLSAPVTNCEIKKIFISILLFHRGDFVKRYNITMRLTQKTWFFSIYSNAEILANTGWEANSLFWKLNKNTHGLVKHCLKTLFLISEFSGLNMPRNCSQTSWFFFLFTLKVAGFICSNNLRFHEQIIKSNTNRGFQLHKLVLP